MKLVGQITLVGTWLVPALAVFNGCHAVSNVATTSYRVATAPVHFVGRKMSGKPQATAAAAQGNATTSDVATPGRPMPSPTSAPNRPGRLIGTSSSVASSPTPTSSAAKKSKSSPPTSSAQTEFPTAKPVPGKPGYVFSPFDKKGRYVDVSGYTRGSKVKDPWTDKIFVVP
jgi:hypothetical protein